MPSIYPRTLATLIADAHRRNDDAMRQLRVAALRLPVGSEAVNQITNALADLDVGRRSLEAASLETSKLVEHEHAVRAALNPTTTPAIGATVP